MSGQLSPVEDDLCFGGGGSQRLVQVMCLRRACTALIMSLDR